MDYLFLDNQKKITIYILLLKDRHQWWPREFRCSLSLRMDKLFPKDFTYIFQHGYLMYYCTYLLENLYVYSLDLFVWKAVSKC